MLAGGGLSVQCCSLSNWLILSPLKEELVAFSALRWSILLLQMKIRCEEWHKFVHLVECPAYVHSVCVVCGAAVVVCRVNGIHVH